MLVRPGSDTTADNGPCKVHGRRPAFRISTPSMSVWDCGLTQNARLNRKMTLGHAGTALSFVVGDAEGDRSVGATELWGRDGCDKALWSLVHPVARTTNPMTTTVVRTPMSRMMTALRCLLSPTATSAPAFGLLRGATDYLGRSNPWTRIGNAAGLAKSNRT